MRGFAADYTEIAPGVAGATVPVACSRRGRCRPQRRDLLYRAGVDLSRRTAMTLCPIALAVGCRKCPAFSVCPLKGVIGDQKKPAAAKKTARGRK
jgi:hypothetical protein